METKKSISIAVEKTGYNYRTRKERMIMAFVYDANGVLLDAIHPGEGNHRTALDWATWRANTIREAYPEAVKMAIHCGDDEIAVITLSTDTTPTETEKEEKTVEVEIYHDGDTCNAMAGGENPVIIGWVDRWFNNTFAAGMQFGIKARKAIAIEELTGRDRAHHGFMSAENAKLWLVDQIKDYFRDHGYNLKVVNL